MISPSPTLIKAGKSLSSLIEPSASANQYFPKQPLRCEIFLKNSVSDKVSPNAPKPYKPRGSYRIETNPDDDEPSECENLILEDEEEEHLAVEVKKTAQRVNTERSQSPFDMGKLIKYLKNTYQVKSKEQKQKPAPNQSSVSVTMKKKKIMNTNVASRFISQQVSH